MIAVIEWEPSARLPSALIHSLISFTHERMPRWPRSFTAFCGIHSLFVIQSVRSQRGLTHRAIVLLSTGIEPFELRANQSCRVAA
jgi:hypothetical protein